MGSTRSTGRLRFGVALAATLGAACAALADTASLTPVKDNTLYEVIEGELSNGAGAYVFVGVTQEPLLRRALIAFDVSVIPAGSTVTSAELTVNVSRINGVPSGELHRVLAGWGEGASDAGDPGGFGAPPMAGDATWEHNVYPSSSWSTPGGDFASAASASKSLATLGAVVWSSTPALVTDVQSWVNAPAGNFGWVVTATGGACRIDSRENLTESARPRLAITFTRSCPADFNQSGAVSVQDIFDFLSAYFAGLNTADFNHSGAVTVQDIFDFLTAYFTPCA